MTGKACVDKAITCGFRNFNGLCETNGGCIFSYQQYQKEKTPIEKFYFSLSKGQKNRLRNHLGVTA
ncbi:MAG: hypothetical protein DRH97_03555 [Chloroflexi bacterium]|nr:MAG: hypothetical protein DRH97_03555 [Chloroflexota bacterium]